MSRYKFKILFSPEYIASRYVVDTNIYWVNRFSNVSVKRYVDTHPNAQLIELEDDEWCRINSQFEPVTHGDFQLTAKGYERYRGAICEAFVRAGKGDLFPKHHECSKSFFYELRERCEKKLEFYRKKLKEYEYTLAGSEAYVDREGES